MRKLSVRGALLAAVSLAGVHSTALAQSAQDFAYAQVDGVVDAPYIISRNDINPNTAAPGGSLDAGITGVGQMIVFSQSSPTAAGLGLCTGTLINPRTVIFAAHCVNSRPAHQYGSQTGTGGGVNGNFGAITAIGATGVTRAPLLTQGVPLSFGFQATNRCTGITPGVNAGTAAAPSAGNGCQAETGAYEIWRNGNFSTNAGAYIYNANQVWYDPRSLGPNSSGFLEGDIALATLDTPAFNVPTWMMLFSPLTEATHALSIGYGVNGTSATAQGPAPGCTTSSPCGAIDYRRRIVENSLDILGSLQDRNAFLFAPPAGPNIQSLYMLDFDSPAGQAAFNTATGNYDFDVFNGAALPREGITAGGDSGGPLVVDTKYSKPVTVGVLSGGSRFFGPQRFSTYGTHSFYQPLFLFWDVIVGNNPYVYAGAKAGNGNWEDASHWVQLMDPNYGIDVNGVLVNGLPDTPALGVSGNTVKFGEICFLDDCTDLADDDTATPLPVGNGTAIYVAGGPGTENFIPDNISPINSADPALNRKARYFDVTLAENGITTLSSTRTIDVLTLDGPATKLSIAATGNLGVFGEYNQWQGWLNVDGKLTTGGDAFIASGILSGKGTLKAPYVTVGAVLVAPGGGDSIGTLTIQGNAILSSATDLFIDAMRGKADQLNVTGDLNVGGDVVFNKVTDGAAPRANESYVIARADGELTGTFAKVYTFQGVLRPQLTYDYTADTVTATLRAGALVEIIDGGSATELAFASALDTLRNGSYLSLWNLYGAVDWMNGAELGATFRALSPMVIGDAAKLQDRQSKLLTASITDRFSLLANGHAEGMSVVGAPMLAMQAKNGGFQSGRLGFGASNSAPVTIGKLPGRMTGFVSGGVERSASSYESDVNRSASSWHLATGLEMPLGDSAILGTATGFAQGESTPGNDANQTRSSMAAAYAVMPLGDGAYIGAVASAEGIRTSYQRTSTDGVNALRLNSGTRAVRYSMVAEAGIEQSLGRGLTVTPRAQLAYSRFKLDGFNENGGETALRIDDVAMSRMEGRIGARFGGTMTLGAFKLTPALTADYVRVLSGRSLDASVRFAAAPDVGFDLPLGESAAGYAEIKGGLTLARDAWSLGLSGQQVIGQSALTDERVQADFSLRF